MAIEIEKIIQSATTAEEREVCFPSGFLSLFMLSTHANDS